MTDSTTAEAQDAGADAAQDATTPSGQDSPATGFDALPPETQAEIRKLRRESAAYRKRVEEYESANQTEADKREAALKAAEDRATKVMATRLSIFGFVVVEEVQADGSARRLRPSEAIETSLARPWRVSKPAMPHTGRVGVPDAVAPSATVLRRL